MKICLILAASFLSVSCAVGHMPVFPDIKDYYVTIIGGEPIPASFAESIVNTQEISLDIDKPVTCLHFQIVSRHPLKIKYMEEVLPKLCHTVGGLKPRENVQFFSWVDDVWSWAETRKKCFK